jgi:spermidine synthase
MSGMTVEMAGSRLLAPYFGNSLIVWANLIGLILLYLTVGYYLGGWWADRDPRPQTLYRLTAMAALAIALLPYLARPILGFAASGFADFRWGLVVSSFLGALLLFGAPMILLGCVSPFAIRLSVRGLHAAGRTAGGVYGLSTIGSLLGVFLSTFWTIPALGVRRTFLCAALLLSALSLLGLWQALGRKAWPYLLLALAILALAILSPVGTIKPVAGLIYEGESAYNYIQVQRQGDDYLLKLNEGEGNQSVYRPGAVLLGRIFDYFLAAPLFRPASVSTPPERVCIIGLAGGTMARQYAAVYGPLPIDGVELDPQIIAVAQRYLDLNVPSLSVFIQDGRYFLRETDSRYDVLIVDAYRPPYIPFHLSTVEFFAEARAHLTPTGVLAVNVGRTEEDQTLVHVIASTIRAVFPTVYIVDAHESYNSMIVASAQPVSADDLTAQIARLTDPRLLDVAGRVQAGLRPFPVALTEPLRDDHAPIEQLIHQMIWRFARAG